MDAQYKDIMPEIADGAIVRLATPFFNIYGLVTLVGGALYSTFLYWRKRVLPYRVVGNILIAVGGLVVASASTLTRFDIASLHSLGELVAAVLMFAGFLVSARPAAESAEAAPAAARAGD
jgi:sulfite exporter TauE/SafE